MGGAAAANVRIVPNGNVDITGYEARRETESPHPFHHQQRQISATSVTKPERKPRLVHSLLRAARVDKAILDCRGQRHQQRAGFIGTAPAKEAPYPTLHGI